MPQQPKLTKKRAKWVKNRNTVLKGSRLAYNAAQQSRYVAALESLVRKMTIETKRQITKLFKGQISNEFFEKQEELAAMDSSLASQARILLNSLSRTFENLFNLKASFLAITMVNGAAKTSAATVGETLKQLSGGLTLKTSIVSEGQEEVATALIYENVKLIESIPKQYMNDVIGSVMRSITTGEGLADLVPDLQKYEGITYRRAKLIALDQTRKAYNSINRQKLLNNGIREFVWRHSGGGLHPRESHIAIDGKTFSFDKVKEQQAALGVPERDRGLPGECINCFLGDTEISLSNGCFNLWRYIHRGDIVNIRLHNSEVLRSTLNHPILTLNGFQAANEIQKGEYLASVEMKNLSKVNGDVAGDKITFDKLFESLNLSLPNRTQSGSKFNFYGDIPIEDVDTISPDNMLPFSFEIFNEQQLEKLFLSLSDVIRNFISQSFSTEVLQFGLPSVDRYCLALLDAETFHPQFISTAPVSDNGSRFSDDTSDYLTTTFIAQRQTQSAFAVFISANNVNTVSFNLVYFPSDRVDIIESFIQSYSQTPRAAFMFSAEFCNTYSRFYRLHRVEEKSISVFDGHVYTMETKKGWYSVTPTEIISKNCRCTMQAIIVFETD